MRRFSSPHFFCPRIRSSLDKMAYFYSMQLTKSKRYLLSSLSGLLLIISFPFTGSITPLIFIALIPLLLVESNVSAKKYKSGKVFIHAYLTFFIFNIGTTWWVANASIGGAAMAILLNSLFMTIAFQLFHLTKKYIGKKEGYFSLILYWISFEYLHYHWELSWTWLTFGNFFSIRPTWIQWYSTSGVLGGSLWVLIGNLLFYRLIENRFLKKESWNIQFPLFSGIALTLILPISYSLYSYYNYSEVEKPFNIAILQPNIDPYNGKFDRSNSEKQLEGLINQANEAKDRNTQLIIAPETALPFGFDEALTEQDGALNFIKKEQLISEESPSWIIGASTHKYFDKKNSRASRKFSENLFYESYNTAVKLEFNDSAQLIHKSKLVPGVEIIPFSDYFPFLEDLSIENGGTTGSLGIESSPKNFTTKNTQIAPVICYESIYGAWVAEQCNQGAQAICIITNDGWWGNSPGYKQHMSFARLRAIENRRSIIRSANTGTSCIINQRGDIIQQTEYWKKETITGKINLNQTKSRYTIYSDVIGRSFTMVSTLLLFYLFVKRFKYKYHR